MAEKRKKIPIQVKMTSARRAPRHDDKNALPKLIETHLGQKYGILIRIKKYVCNVQHAFNNGIFLLLGTNLGGRQQNLAMARDLLTKKAGEILTRSSIYSTKAWGNTSQPDFLNQVVKINT